MLYIILSLIIRVCVPSLCIIGSTASKNVRKLESNRWTANRINRFTFVFLLFAFRQISANKRDLLQIFTGISTNNIPPTIMFDSILKRSEQLITVMNVQHNLINKQICHMSPRGICVIWEIGEKKGCDFSSRVWVGCVRYMSYCIFNVHRA